MFQALTLVVLAVILGLGRNALSGKPLPLFQGYNPRLSDTLNIRDLSLVEVQEAWEKHWAVFLDARREELFREGHIPGAKRLFLDDFNKLYPGLSLSTDEAYVTYCEGPNCEYAHLLAQRLHGLGYRKLSVFPGGWEEWMKAKYPVEKSGGP